MKSLQFIEVDTDGFDTTSSPADNPRTWRFAIPTDYLPRDVDCIPSVSAINFTPATISLGEDLGQRASLTVTFKDHRHIMNGEPFDQGTFWGKWRARYGQKLRGRAVRWLNGLEGQALVAMPTRHFFIDSVDGPTPDGIYTIVAKDLLKFADDDRAQAPVLSNGTLAGGINDTDLSLTLSPTGIGDVDYPTSGYACIGGKEIVAFTRGSPSDVMTITRGQLNTSPITHAAGERVQLVLNYAGNDPADIIYDLFTNYAGMNASLLPLTSWQAETAANLGVIYARPITEPTPVNKLVSELIEQAALAVWWDELARIVRLQVLKEISTDADTFDEEVILEGSLKTKEQPDKRISEIWAYYGQRNPADRGDNEDNYRNALADVDLQRETEYGGSLIRKIIGTWIATENAAQRLTQVQLSRFRDPPRRFNFDLFPGASISAGQGYRLKWRQNQDVLGNMVSEGAPIQITRVSVEAGVIHVEAEEMLASGVVVLTNCVILTDTSGLLSWTVPATWNSANNSIHAIGGGGFGGFESGSFNGGSGGGGGAYSGIANLALTPAASISYRVGAGGTDAGSVNGGDTWFNGATLAASSVGAKGGTAASFRTPGTGGAAASGVGTTKHSGGNGGTGGTDSGGGAFAGSGGGGGAGGPNGDGARGGNVSGEKNGQAGGGGADGGSAGSTVTDDNNSNGGNNRFSFGGGTASSAAVDGGGGYGEARGGIGEPLWTQTIAPIISAGPGGGGGAKGDGGSYGGGGGAAKTTGFFPPVTVSGFGAQGVIAIIWQPA